ncbi:MAG TPA: hypothetical protein VD978_15620 [Azospirillum sp.]|nr:hypothetical protein [Azospirillum sp.]
MQTFSLEDSRTLQAIGILADVLDGVSGSGGLDTVLVSKALRQVVATKSQPAFEFATRAFNTLDPEVRRKVAEDADTAARDAVELRGRVAGFLSTAARKERGPAQAPTNFLTALNLRNKRRKPEA